MRNLLIYLFLISTAQAQVFPITSTNAPDQYYRWTGAKPAGFEKQGQFSIYVEPVDSGKWMYALYRTKKPFKPVTIQATKFTTQQGIQVNTDFIGSTDTGDFVTYAVNTDNADSVIVEYARAWQAGNSWPELGVIEVRSPTGKLLSTIKTKSTGSWNVYGKAKGKLWYSDSKSLRFNFLTVGSGNIKSITVK
jgi:hypothetical protein